MDCSFGLYMFMNFAFVYHLVFTVSATFKPLPLSNSLFAYLAGNSTPQSLSLSRSKYAQLYLCYSYCTLMCANGSIDDKRVTTIVFVE